MPDDIERIDVREVCCGLMPALARHLATSSAQIVEFKVRPGIRAEMLSSLGTSQDWSLEFEAGADYDVARFTRRQRTTPPGLNRAGY